jgi:hypothetical protein
MKVACFMHRNEHSGIFLDKPVCKSSNYEVIVHNLALLYASNTLYWANIITPKSKGISVKYIQTSHAHPELVI